MINIWVKVKYFILMFLCTVLASSSLYALYIDNYQAVGLLSGFGVIFYVKSVDYLRFESHDK